jgi:N-acetyl sugar amidotransferase
MNIAYFLDINCNHGQKWVEHSAQSNKVIAFCTEAIKDKGLYENSNVIVYPILANQFPLNNPFKRKKYLAKIKSVLEEHKIDMVHAMYAVPYAFWAYASGHEKLIITTRGSDVLIDFKSYLYPRTLPQKISYPALRQLFIDMLEKAKVITCTSYGQADAINTFIKEKGKIQVVRTGVDVSSFSHIDALKKEKENSRFVIFSPRAMRSLYNQHLIVEGFKLFLKKHPNGKFLLKLIDFGSDPNYLSEIKNNIENSGIKDSIKIHRTLSKDELIKEYASSDLIVMVPKSDGTPVSGIESMLSKTPLVIGDLNYDKDIFNEETIWKLNKTSPETIAEAFDIIYTSDKTLLKSKVDKAYETAIEKADLNNSLKRISSVYNTILKIEGVAIEYKACSKCVLTSSDDPDLYVNDEGVCNHCVEFDQIHAQHVKTYTPENLEKVLAEIKVSKGSKKYDSILGISGGIDSSYLAYLSKKNGLSPLIVHFDNGWNSELAVKNIESIISSLDLDLYTYINNWEEYRDIQLSFLKASVVDIELITDHAIFAVLYNVAIKHGIKYVLVGTNTATEAILPESWYHWKADWENIRSIHKKFGTVKLKTYPHFSFFKKEKIERLHKIKLVPLLNYFNYNKEEVKKTLIAEIGFRDYGGKHSESIFTRFYQSYILPNKFGIDKRKAHLSSLICSGQITRAEAFEILKQDMYAKGDLMKDKEFALKKFGLSEKEFESIMNFPVKKHLDYNSYFHTWYKRQKQLSVFLSRIKKIF